jgi:hypothetical protein
MYIMTFHKTDHKGLLHLGLENVSKLNKNMIMIKSQFNIITEGNLIFLQCQFRKVILLESLEMHIIKFI